jgi:electron transfer flavoprotein-quinone oxidoreductase
MDFAMASGSMAGRAVLHAREQQDFSSGTLAYYDSLLADSFVLRDLKTFESMPRMLENPRVFGQYPEVIADVARGIFAFGSEPKARFVPTALRAVRGRLNLLDLARDAWTARKL